MGCTSPLLPLEGEANFFLIDHIIFNGTREMIGNRDNNTIETYEHFSYFPENRGPNGSLKSKKGKWIGVSFQCKNLKRLQYVHGPSKLESA